MDSLYKQSERWKALLEGCWHIDEETGEVFSPEDIDEVQASFEEKAENVALYVKNLEAEIKALRDEEESLRARRVRKERHAERLKTYLLDCMNNVGKRSFETTKAAMSLRRVRSVHIADESAVPPEYCKTTVKTAPDKRAIGYALKEGKSVPGCALAERDSISIK